MPAVRSASLQEDAYLRSLAGQPYGSPRPIVNCWRVDGPFDAAAFRVALDQLSAAHPALRRHFPDERTGVVAEPTGCHVARVDGLGADPLEEMFSVLGRRFRLDTAPMWRAAVAALGPRSHLLGLSLDHLVFDGLSVSMLLAELGTRYDAVVDGRRVEPTDGVRVVRTYDEFAAQQRTRLDGEWGRRRREFWRQTTGAFGPYPPRSPLGTGTVPGSGPAVVVRREIAAEPVRATVEQAAGRNLTAFALAATAVFVAVAEVSGRAPVGLVADAHGRCLPGFSRTAGLFSHGMPVFADGASGGALLDRAVGVQERVVDAVDHALPLRAVDRLWNDDLVSPTPAPHLLLHLVDGSRRDLSLAGLDVRRVAPEVSARPGGRLQCELELRLASSGCVQFVAEHDPELYPPEDVVAVLERALDLLAGFPADRRRRTS